MITLTETAASRFKEQLISNPKAIGIRLGVRATGCSGYAYVLNFEDNPKSDQVVFESYGIKIFTTQSDLSYIDGTKIDYVKQGLNEAFKFHNPKVTGECGCGESFTI